MKQTDKTNKAVTFVFLLIMQWMKCAISGKLVASINMYAVQTISMIAGIIPINKNGFNIPITAQAQIIKFITNHGINANLHIIVTLEGLFSPLKTEIIENTVINMQRLNSNISLAIKIPKKVFPSIKERPTLSRKPSENDKRYKGIWVTYNAAVNIINKILLTFIVIGSFLALISINSFFSKYQYNHKKT